METLYPGDLMASRSSPWSRFAPVERWHIPLLLICVLIGDAYGLLHLHAVIQGWDGADLGSIARNYFRNGLHLLLPQVDWGGNGPGYVEMQLPLTPYLTALLYKVFGFHEQLAIVVPFLSGLATVLAVYFFARHVHTAPLAFLAGAFVALSTYWDWQSTIFVNDPFMIACGTLGLYVFYLWIENGGWVPYALSAALIALAILLKITALYLGFPLLFLWIVKHRSAAWRRPSFWLYGLMVLLPPAAWYVYAHDLYLRFGNTFGIVSGGSSKFATLDLLLSPGFYAFVAGRMIRFVFTPLVFLCLVPGFLRWEKEAKANVFRVWMASVLVYQIVVGKGTFLGVQYLMPILPPAAVVAGSGFFFLIKKLRSIPVGAAVMRLWNGRFVGAVLLLMFAANYLWSMRMLRYMEGLDQVRRIVGHEVAAATPPGSLIVVASTNQDEALVARPDQLSTPPQIFYYSDRKGWYLPMRWFDARSLEDRREGGASFVVIPLEVADFVAHHPMYGYLSENYAEIFRNDVCLVFDLRTKKRS